MGIYDRDYGRDGSYGESPGFHLGGPRSWTTNLVIVMFGIYVVQLLTTSDPNNLGWFTNTLRLHADVLQRPWLGFQFLSYGFLHDPGDLRHILFNMLGLWMFGRAVESRYGKREYLIFFLVAIVLSGLAWVLAEFVSSREMLQNISMLGASGGVAAVLLLFALNFPRRLIFVWAILPVPAWAFALFFVGMDIMGAVSREGNVAYAAHLGGAIFAVLYYKFGWKLGQYAPAGVSLPRLRRGPKLRVHDPMEEESETETRVDEILRKIQQHGQESLTRRERRILEQASRDYQRKRE